MERVLSEGTRRELRGLLDFTGKDGATRLLTDIGNDNMTSHLYCDIDGRRCIVGSCLDATDNALLNLMPWRDYRNERAEQIGLAGSPMLDIILSKLEHEFGLHNQHKQSYPFLEDVKSETILWLAEHGSAKDTEVLAAVSA